MSSRSRTWSERRPPRAAAAVLAVALAWWAAAAPAYAAVPLPVGAVLTGGGQTSVVVDLSASTKPGPRTVTVTRNGVPQQARLVPVMNDDLGVTLVVDTSAAAGGSLPAWLSGAARFILEAPDATRGVIIADSKPAAAITPPQRGPTEIVKALTAVKARGERDTGTALTLAASQFRDSPAGHRVTVLYTTAADAGGVSAADLAARFRAAGTILVVAGTTDGGTYWSEASQGSGGFFAPAGNPVVVPALDQVQTTLSSRYLVVFPTPPRLPARVTVQVGTGDLTLTADVVVPVPGAAPPRRPSELSASTVVWWSLAGAGLVGLILVAVLLWRLRAAAGTGSGSPVATTPPLAPVPPPAGRNAPARVAWATGRHGGGWNAFPAAARSDAPATRSDAPATRSDAPVGPSGAPAAVERAASPATAQAVMPGAKAGAPPRETGAPSNTEAEVGAPREAEASASPREAEVGASPREAEVGAPAETRAGTPETPADIPAPEATEPSAPPEAAAGIPTPEAPELSAPPGPTEPTAPPEAKADSALPDGPDRPGTPSVADTPGRTDTAVHARARVAPAPWAGNLPVYALPEGPGPEYPDDFPPVARGRAPVRPYVARGRAHVPGAEHQPAPDADDVNDGSTATRTENESRNSD